MRVPGVDRHLDRSAYLVDWRRRPERLEQRRGRVKDRVGQISLRKTHDGALFCGGRDQILVDTKKLDHRRLRLRERG